MKRKIIAIGFFSFCACAIWYGFYQNNQLAKNGRLVTGVVEDVSYSSKGSDYFVTYYFILNDKVFESKTSIPYSKFKDVLFLDALLKRKVLPVIYQADNPDNSKMLLTRHDYEKYGIQIPSGIDTLLGKIDSLRRDAN